jgi:hypothetical protein
VSTASTPHRGRGAATLAVLALPPLGRRVRQVGQQDDAVLHSVLVIQQVEAAVRRRTPLGLADREGEVGVGAADRVRLVDQL